MHKVKETPSLLAPSIPALPDRVEDNTQVGLALLKKANLAFRENAWPAPFDTTTHLLRTGDARQLDFVANESIDLVVTSPPYWTLKEYGGNNPGQLGDIDDYELFLSELDKAWSECFRVLRKGGRVCCVVGDVCVPRKRNGRHFVLPLHADIQVRARGLGFDSLTPILWHKIANGTNEVKGNGSGFYGKPYQPGAVIKNDIEYILFLRKPGGYRKPTLLQKALSMITKDELTSWMQSIWTDITGENTRNGHPAPYPAALASRLIRMFSFAGDTVLDPFVGTGSTSIAALETGRNSIGVDINAAYLQMAEARVKHALTLPRATGSIRPKLLTKGLE